jgi:cytochrome c
MSERNLVMRKVLLAALVLGIAVAAGPAGAKGDSDAGAKVFKKCKACHQVGPGAKSKVGPELNGIIGRPIASSPKFKYSKAFRAKKAEGIVWDEGALDAFLKKPRKAIAKNKMAFPGLKKQKQRDDVIEYLKRFGK